MAKDLHDEPFDEGTLEKLKIFEDYAQAWIPTFVMQGVKTICIFDFFAGTGYDIKGVAGSPIRILQKIKEQIGNIHQRGVKIKFYVNEFKKKKFELLMKAIEEYLQKNSDVKRAVDVIYSNEDFDDIFTKLLDKMRDHRSLIYFDQSGMKYLSDKYLIELEKMKQTDFLYFVSSSYFWRFGDTREFQENIKLDMEAAKKNPFKYIHQSLLEQLRNKLSANTRLKLYPFTIKKGSGIYGIVFGASHIRAVDKFLKIAWYRNEVNGQANFDLYDDATKQQYDLFLTKRLTKLEAFKSNLKANILNGNIKNNLEALEFTYKEGHIPKYSSDCIREMKKDKLISYNEISPLVNYEQVFKNERSVKFKIIN